jgi:hypothetical protein
MCEAIAFATIGFVPGDTVGKVAAAREHRNPGLGGGHSISTARDVVTGRGGDQLDPSVRPTRRR